MYDCTCLLSLVIFAAQQVLDKTAYKAMLLGAY